MRKPITVEKMHRGASRFHRILWSWLAENPTKRKSEWPGWKRFRERPVNRCFGCGVRAACEKCPLLYERDGDKICCDGIFDKWQNSYGDNEERSKYARQIANLPWKTANTADQSNPE